jgi:HSP20 family molecular chaperone IbpA
MYYPNIFDENLYSDLFNEVLNFPVDYGKRIRNELVDKRRCTTDIKEYEDKYELEMEFPGYDKSDIKAELKNGYLIVSAEHTEQKDTGDAAENADANEAEATGETNSEAKTETKAKEPIKYICRERFYGKTERSFYVGKNVTKDDIKAQYTNGVLTLAIPKEVNKPEKESEIISITD